MAAGPKGAGGYQQLNMSTAVDESIGIEPQDAQSGEGPGLLHPPPPLQRTTHPIIVDWLKHPEPGIAATARLFQLPSYMIEQQKGVAELMQDLVGLNKAIEQSIADEEERQATSPDARAGHLRRINRTAERLADTASALRIVQGKSIVTKKVPFDETEAKVDDDGWIRAPLTGKDEPVRKYPLCNTSVAELGSIGGVGLRLYFFIIKFLAGLCFLMGVITLPALTSFISDEMYHMSDAKPFRTSYAFLTLGNVHATQADIKNGRAPVLFVASQTDALATLAAVFAIMWLGGYIKTMIQDTDLATATMQDYSVQITPVRPIEAPELKTVKAWDRYTSQKASLYEMGGAKMERFHEDLAMALGKALKSQDVIAKKENGQDAIWSAWNEETNMKLWGKKLKLLQELEEGLGKAAKKQGYDAQLKVLKSTLGKLAKVKKGLIELNGEPNKYRPVTAFVTFEDAEQQERALALGSKPSVGSGHDEEDEESPLNSTVEIPPDGQYEELSEREIVVGDWVCEIVEAPEPDTIKWPHLAYSGLNRKIRRYLMNFATFLLLMVGFAICTQANHWQSAASYTSECNNVLGPEAKWDTAWTMNSACPGILKDVHGAEPVLPVCLEHDTQNTSASWADLGEDCTRNYVDNSQVYRNAYKNLKPLGQTNLFQSERQSFPKISKIDETKLPYKNKCGKWSEWRVLPGRTAASCHRVDGKGRGELVYPGGDMDTMCYACACQLTALATKVEYQLDKDYCDPFKKDFESTKLWKILGATIMVIINQLLKRGIIGSVDLLKAHTLEVEMASSATRVFACQLVNTVILTVLLKSELPVFEDLPGHHYNNANSKWFAKVAAPMAMTMVFQFVLPWLIHAGVGVFGKVCRCCARCQSKTQNGLNRSQAPNDFDLAGSYGEILLAMSVILVFGSGVPVLYWIGAFGFSLRFWVDKYVVLRECKRPPMISESLFEHFDEVLMLVLLGHVAMGCYMLATAGGTDPIAEAVFQPFAAHVFPMYGAAGVVVCAWQLKLIGQLGCTKRAMQFRCFPSCLKFLMATKTMEDEEEKLLPFSEASKLGSIANDMDSYDFPLMTEFRDTRRAMKKAIDGAHSRARPPFSGSDDNPVYAAVLEQTE